MFTYIFINSAWENLIFSHDVSYRIISPFIPTTSYEKGGEIRPILQYFKDNFYCKINATNLAI